jgi:hypothetical protein
MELADDNSANDIKSMSEEGAAMEREADEGAAEQMDTLGRLKCIVEFIKANPDLERQMAEIKSHGDITALYGITQHGALFREVCTLGGRKFMDIWKTLRYTGFDKIIVYFADYSLYVAYREVTECADFMGRLRDIVRVVNENTREKEGCAKSVGCAGIIRAVDTKYFEYVVSQMMFSNTNQRFIVVGSVNLDLDRVLHRITDEIDNAETRILDCLQEENDEISYYIHRRR